jgi:hypothetical protein
MSLYEKLSNNAKVDNCHPLFIAVVDGKKEIVANVIDGEVYLTEAGKVLLADAEPKAVKTTKASKKAEPVVELANTSASGVDDLDLGE